MYQITVRARVQYQDETRLADKRESMRLLSCGVLWLTLMISTALGDQKRAEEGRFAFAPRIENRPSSVGVGGCCTKSVTHKSQQLMSLFVAVIPGVVGLQIKHRW